MKVPPVEQQVNYSSGFNKRFLVVLFIIISSVSVSAQTPLRPVFPSGQVEAGEDSTSKGPAGQAEAGEDLPPNGSAGQMEANEDLIPKDPSRQAEAGEDSSLDYSSGQREVIPAGNSSPGTSSDFFIAPLVEIIGYSRKGPSFGAGFALGAGNGVAIGMRFLYGIDTESIHMMELGVFLRFYLQGASICTGPFFQLNAGASIYNHKHAVYPPARVGALSSGISAGWRFRLGKRWYFEPSIRAGYPYIAGVGASFAFRL